MAAFSFGINAEAQTTGKVRVPNRESGQSLTITPPLCENVFKGSLRVEIQAGNRADLKRGDVVEAVPRNRNVIKKQKKYADSAAPDTLFYDNFDDKDYCLENYTYIDVDNDGYAGDDGLDKSRWFWKEDELLMQFCSDNINIGNDWLITPAIKIDGTSTYHLNFNVNMGAPSNMKVTLGTSANPEDHTVELYKFEGEHWQQGKPCDADFKVDKPGDYYIGFYAYNGLDGFYLNLFDVTVTATGVFSAAPDSVKGLTVISGAFGAEEAVISFTAPDRSINGKVLETTLNANIYRDDELIHNADVQPGQQFEWKDSEVAAGTHTYVVACENEAGEGFPTSRTVYVGQDLPGVVRDFKAVVTDNGMAVDLSWKAPEAGASGGYFNPDDVTYAVLISNDGNEFYVVKDNLTQFSYKDTDIERNIDELGSGYQQEGFYYAVAAVNKAGNGGAEPEYVVVGEPYKLPVTETFSSPFDLNPWQSNSITGYFGFKNMHNDSDAGVYPYNGVNGFNKFYNPWGDSEVDSRLISPMVDLSNAEKPVVSFFMYHWNVADIDPSGQNTYLAVEISEDGGETFTSLCEPIMACSDTEGWVEHHVSLEKYKGKTPLRLSFRGYMDCNWMYYYIDEIRVEEQPVKDLAVLTISATETVKMNGTSTVSFTYHNRGTETVSDYSLDLYLGDELLQSLDGESINYGEQKTVEYTHLTTAAYAGRELEYHVEISYADDENKDNNVSPTVTTAVGDTWYPVAEDLKAVCGNGKISVQWMAPEIPDTPEETTDGAEDYEPFAISGFGDWLVYDGDQKLSGGFTDLPEVPNMGENMAFQIWSPYYLTPDTTDWENNFPYLLPRTGDQCFISWYASLSIWGEEYIPSYNDDWLISEEILGGSDLSFYIKKINPNSTAEDPYEVLYSSTDREIGSFEKIDGGIAGNDWELKEIALPENARYFAIRNYADPTDGWGFMVDDITFTSALYALEVEGYNVFRNEQKLNAALLESPVYEDTDVTEGETYEYAVSTVFNLGESVVCDPVSVTYINSVDDETCGIVVRTMGNTLTVETGKEEKVTVYKADGSIVADTYTEGNVAVFQLENGVYVVKVGNEVTKAVI